MRFFESFLNGFVGGGTIKIGIKMVAVGIFHSFFKFWAVAIDGEMIGELLFAYNFDSLEEGKDALLARNAAMPDNLKRLFRVVGFGRKVC